MPRGERPLDDGDGPLLRFAADLRRLREQAGGPVYRELSRRAHYSTAVLSEAAGGRKLPSLAVTLAYVTACDGDAATWEQRWREVSAELSPVEAPPPTRSPYLGAAAFDIGDADRFFGRDALVGELVAAVGEHRLVVVHGASGSGKSSLLRAGLAARDRRRVVVFTPGPHPIEECAVRLAVVADWSAPRLRDEIAADPGNFHLRIRQAVADDNELLLVVDQFEEVFTACADETERATFIAALVHAAGADTSRCRVVLGVRADFLDRFDEELPDAHPFPMRAMTTDELREAVTRPASAVGLTLETALVARVIADASSCCGALPLVSRALRETWHRRQGMTLTVAAYDEAGGIRHAIARAAESVYLAFAPAERDIARRIFLRLTAFGDGAEDTKRRVGRCELDDGPQTAAVLAELVRARLVVVGRHDMELTHDALLVTWSRLREWLSEDRDGLRTHRQLTEAAAAWIALDRDSGALYRGLRLLIAEEWVNRAKPVLSARERMFFTASLYAERNRERFDRKRTRRLRQLVAMLVVLLMVTVFVGVQAFLSGRRQLEEQAVQNIVGQLPALVRTNQYLAGQLSLAAFHLVPDSPKAAGRLLQFTAQRHSLPDATRAEAVGTNAALMATGATDGALTLTNLALGVGDVEVPGFGVAVDSLALSADGKVLAASYVDGTLLLWDLSSWTQPVRAWSHHGSRVLVSFSRTGRTLATGGHPVEGDSTLAPVDSDTTLWDVANPYDPRKTGTLRNALGPVQFSADGRTLAAVSSGGDVHQPQVWRQADGRWAALPTTTPDQDGDFVAESISADGSLVVAVTSDLHNPLATLWDVRADKIVLQEPLSNTPLPVPIAFDPSTNRVAGVNADGMVEVWQLDRSGHHPSAQFELDANPRHLRSVFFTADGRLVTIADDAVTVWAMNTAAAAAAVCRLPRTGLIPQTRWDDYFTGMDVPMPCDN